MIRHDLTLAEQHAIGLAIDGLTGLAMAAGDAALVEHAVLAAHAMPRTLRELMVVAVRLREGRDHKGIGSLARPPPESSRRPDH
jgi:hypothetical protein